MSTAKGISIPFTFDTTGYPASNSGEKLVNDSIFTILSTYIGERVHRPTFGSILLGFVFDPLTLATMYRVKAEIRRAVAAWESRATITTINFSTPKDGVLMIMINWIANGGLKGITQFPITVNSGA